ncbi:MAG: 2-oxo acid dehydrogenase subunit E2 [Archangium sp.]
MLTKRTDGTLVQNLSATRAIMPLLMQTRTESAVYFEQELDVTETMRFVDAWNDVHPEQKITLFTVYMWAAASAFHERQRMNRFISGGRIYQRKGVYLSFAAKKKKLDDEAALVTIKREMKAGATLAEVAKNLSADIKTGRSETPRAEDRELELTQRLPQFMVRIGLWAMKLADRWNLLPQSVIDHDPCYASMFVANLGSVGLDAAYHHLYEWGNCPFFAALGRTKEVNGRLIATVKYSFDERIDDGLSCARALQLVKERVEAPAKFEALPSTFTRAA